jgi:DNA-binding transcriptional MerR regulator
MPTAKRKRAKVQAEVVIPEKIYFRIGEVSELAALPTYVLRFWETEFSQLKPTKSSTGQRMYRRKDVEYVMQIRKLLYEDGFTIAGAREKLREELRASRLQNHVLPPPPPQISPETDAAVTESQAILPFLAPVTAARSQRDDRTAHNAILYNHGSKEELRRVRQQLCEVLNLLS